MTISRLFLLLLITVIVTAAALAVRHQAAVHGVHVDGPVPFIAPWHYIVLKL
jgi:hypothetical protein